MEDKVTELAQAATEPKPSSAKPELELATAEPEGMSAEAQMQTETELAQAARDNQLQAMERLIADGVSADAKDERGNPALTLF